MKNIQINNTGFINKGAELMLRSIVDRFNNDKNTNLIFNGSKRNASWEQKASLNLFSQIKLERYKIDWSFLFPKDKFLSQRIVFTKDINILFDAGGFHIGDQWVDEKHTKKDYIIKLDYYRNLKRKGVKIIFLPQAFGPFENELSKFYFKELYKISDFFFARDKISFHSCKDIIPDIKKIKLAPDFTNLYKPQLNDLNKLVSINQLNL